MCFLKTFHSTRLNRLFAFTIKTGARFAENERPLSLKRALVFIVMSLCRFSEFPNE